MIDFSNPQKGTEVDLPELSAARELAGARFVVEEVFAGGMGICLKVLHANTKESFGLKVIKPEFLGDRSTWVRFIEELKWWLTLSACDGVAEAHCIARVNEIPCMCAAWLHHGNLRQFIGRGKPEFVFQTMLRIVRTLEWAHSKHKVIHRDLKPENILLDQDWRAFVSDWGLAKPLNSFFEETRRSGDGTAVALPHLTQTGDMVGTILYAAPEQILGLPTIDHRADIYSLGCMLFEWETGRPPFMGSTFMEVAQQHLQVPAPKLGGLFRKTKLGLDEVIARCLSKEPGKRFQDYDSLARAVLSVAKHRKFSVVDFRPAKRYHRPVLGDDELKRKLGKAHIEWNEVEPHLDEAHALCSLGEYEKAAKILEPLYIEDLCRKTRAWSFCHTIAINYADCLCQSEPCAARAVRVFESVIDAEPKSAEFFVNFSIALIHARDAARAEQIAARGLESFPDDKDILGNLMLAQRLNKKLDAAVQTSRRFLSVCRDFHALEDVAGLFRDLAHREGENWPRAVAHLKNALRLLEEARHLNPRYAPARFILAQVLHELECFGESNNECAEILQFVDNRSLREAAICLRAENLSDVSANQECLDFCNNWMPKLTIPHLAEDLERIRAKLIVDAAMIDREKNGSRISVPQVEQFFKRKVENNLQPSWEDALYHARICEWLDPSEKGFELLNWIEGEKPGWWKVHYFRAEFLYRRGKRDAAIFEIRKSIAAAPFRSGPMLELADYHERCGNLREAERVRKEAEAVSTRRRQLKQLER